jgi:hypothetical protein
MSDYQQLAETMRDVLGELIEIDREIINAGQAQERLRGNMSNASLHWRRDRAGNRTMLELVHPSGSDYERANGRRREYIGTDPGNVAQARQRIKNYDEYQKLEYLRREATRQAQRIRGIIRQLALVTLGEQAKLWGQTESDSAPIHANDVTTGCTVSPQDMSPQDVLNYFENSPSLCVHADDLRQSPPWKK